MNERVTTERPRHLLSKRLEWFVRGGFGLMLGILAVIGTASFYSIHQLSKIVVEQRSHYEMILSFEQLRFHLLDAESSQRGYIISGDKEYLGLFDEALRALEQDFINIRALDKRYQKKRMEMLQTFVGEKIDMLESNISLRDKEGFQAAGNVLTTGNVKKLMDAIRELIREMRAEESIILEKSNNELQIRAVMTEYVIAFGCTVAFLFVVISGWFIKRSVSDQRRIQEELFGSEEKLKAILDNATAVVYVKDLQGKYLLINRRFKEMFHLSEMEILRKTDFDLFAREIAEGFHRNDQKVLQTECALEFEETAIVDGEPRTYISLKFPLRSLSGKPYAVCGISTDITDRKRMATELEAAKQTAESASRAKSDFLATMSHELRTPLNAIIGFSEVLAMQNFGPLNKKQKEYVSDVFKSGKHLMSLINDILDLSKIEAGKMGLELGECLVSSIIQNSVAMIKDRAARHGIAIDVDVDQSIHIIRVDERKLKQIMFNLLSNAIEFTPDGGRVGIEIKRSGARTLLCCVSDTGAGIEDKDKAKMFQEFVQVSNSPRLRQGTGLGLVLTKKIVELYGGKIWFESEGKDKGSRFNFTLPETIIE